MELMKDKDFQEKVQKVKDGREEHASELTLLLQYAKDPEGMKKLIEEFKDKV